ncbi:MAG TPA: DUF1810 domain-containing protein [Sphingomicrobium sp.]|nr:DUF1810 domain-containing protein [Sphingomicrobium sp.]
MTDPHDLQRFVDAQRDTFEVALAEIRAGAKRSHWMWFIFPQLRGLGHSPTAQFFGIASLDEARAYLAHPLLGARLRECVAGLSPWAGRRDPVQIFGPVDALKLGSSLTLFDQAAPGGCFGEGLDSLFCGKRDTRTLALLNAPQ